jgi:hypothetical protein
MYLDARSYQPKCKPVRCPQLKTEGTDLGVFVSRDLPILPSIAQLHLDHYRMTACAPAEPHQEQISMVVVAKT